MNACEPERFTATSDGRLTHRMREAWQRDGYLVVDRFHASADCDGLRARAESLIDAFDENSHRTAFSAHDQSHAEDRYFRESASNISFFFERSALAPGGELLTDKRLAINKIGHAMHDLDPVFDAFSREARLATLVGDLGLRKPLFMQSMYLCKQPRIGDEVGMHQDSTFLRTDPESVIGLWVALEDATIDNGCLCAARGGHRGSLRQWFHERDGVMVLDTLDATPFPEPDTLLEAPAGTLVVLHGRLPHGSSANTSGVSRHAYAVHVVDGECEWRGDNWLQRRRDLPARGF